MENHQAEVPTVDATVARNSELLGLKAELLRIFRYEDDDAMDTLVDSRHWPDVCAMLREALR